MSDEAMEPKETPPNPPVGQSAQDLASQNKIEAMGRRQKSKPRYSRMGVEYEEAWRLPEYK